MTRLLLTVVLLCPGAARAGGYANWVEVPFVVPDPGPLFDPYGVERYLDEGHHVFDLLTVSVGDAGWVAAWADAYLEGGAAGGYSLWDYPSGGALPNPSAFPYFPLMMYESFWTSPEEYPNPDLNPATLSTVFAPGSPLRDDATHKEAEWYVDPTLPNVHGGTSTVARFNVMGLCPAGFSDVETPFGSACDLVIDGHYYYDDGGDGGVPFQLRIPICWYVPEPSGLALLGLGVWLIGRRQ